MKKVVLVFLAGIAVSVSVSAQSELTYNKGVCQNGTKVKPVQIREIMSGNIDALQQYNSGRSLSVTGQVIAYPCAFLLGFDLGTRLGGGKGNGTVLGIGAAGTLIGLIMSSSGEKKIKKSVSLYNSNANNGSVSYQIDFGFTPTSIGFSMQF